MAHLHTALTEELVSGPEGDLDDSAELGQFLGGVGLNVGNALEVGCTSAKNHMQGEDIQMSILTICFQAVKRSIRMSEGLCS